MAEPQAQTSGVLTPVTLENAPLRRRVAAAIRDAIEVGKLPPGARPDLSVDGTVQIERIADAVFVGRPAFGQPESKATLFKFDPNTSIAMRVPVTLGRASVNLIEVTQGLQPGDVVILSDTSAWDEHDRLRVD